MENIHVLPTDKPSRLIIYSTLLNEFRLLDEPIENWKHKKNIYITNSEEIKEGDWCIIEKSKLGKRTNKQTYINCNDGESHLCYYYTINNINESYHLSYCKKIILTTDVDLIKDGVQAIPDEFIEWFVKNPNCEWVEIRKIEDELISPKNPKIRFNALQDPPSFISAESLNNMILTYKYKIIIPQELVNPNNQEVMFSEEHQEYFHEDFIDGKKVTVWLGKNYTPKETSKQSTKDRIMSETSEETKQKARDYGNSLIKQDRTCTHNCSAVCGECQILEPKPLLSVDWLLRYIEDLAKKGYNFMPSSNKEIVEHVKQMEKDNMINFLKSVFQQDGFDYEKAFEQFKNK